MTKPGKQVAGSEIRVIERAPMPAMRLVGSTTTDAPAALRWTMMLVWFMRTMAVVWIAKGLFSWTIVLGINHAVADFREIPIVLQALIGFFAVADLMAAVGLWLAAPWGGVLWLICAATEVMASTLGAGASMTGLVGVVLDGLLIAVYFALNWLAANERV
jgi:hypothetical protein